MPKNQVQVQWKICRYMYREDALIWSLGLFTSLKKIVWPLPWKYPIRPSGYRDNTFLSWGLLQGLGHFPSQDIYSSQQKEQVLFLALKWLCPKRTHFFYKKDQQNYLTLNITGRLSGTAKQVFPQSYNKNNKFGHEVVFQMHWTITPWFGTCTP